MRKLITIILVLAASVAFSQTTYQLNYDSIRVGKTAGNGATSLYGKTYLKNATEGTPSDSVLTVRNGRVYKIAGSAISSVGFLTYVFSRNASDISGYEQMPALTSYTAGAADTATVAATTTPAIIQEFATNTGFPNTTLIPSGVFNVTYQTQKNSGSQSYYTYAVIYKRNLSGTETAIATTNNSSSVSANTVQSVSVSAVSPADISVLTTDRIVVKVFAAMVSGTANISIYYDDATDSRLAFPSALVDATNFVPYNGAVKDLVSNYSITGDSIKRVGGTGAQFLMGNGTVQDTTAIQTVSNFFPKGDTRYAKGFGDAVLTTGNQSVSGIKTFGSTTNFSGGNVMLTSTSDQYFRANNVSSSGRKGLYMADGSTIDFKVYSGGNQTLGAFTEGVDLLVIGTGYQGGGAGSEKILFHSTGKGNMFSMNASAETNTSYFPLVVNGAVTASSFSGNATSATTLANTRTIWGQNFNGSGNVTGTLTGTIGNFGISNIGNWTSDANYARFGHSNFTSSGVYGFMQNNTGSTFINGTINEIFGDIRANDISGSGNRIIIANGSNVLKPAVIGSGLSFDGTTLTATGGTSGSVTTSGLTSGFIPKATGASDLGNSNLQDNGTNLFTTTYMDFVRPLGSNAITIGESAGANRLTIGQESSYAGNVINSSNIDLKLRSYLSGGTGGNIIFYTGNTSPAPEAGRFNSSGNLVLVNSATATSFIKSGGTSSQFLMADGSAVTAIPSATTATTQTQGDNSTKIATTAYVDRLGGGIITSGRYDGLITGGTNVTGTSYTVNGAHYRRIGNEVTVTGRCSLTTTSSGASVFYIDLPIASNLSAGADLLGAANADTNSTNIVINADTGGDRALVEFTAAGNSFMTVYYNFTYTVL